MSEFVPVSVPRTAPPEFGSQAQNINVTTIPLTNALDSKEFVIKGAFFWVVNASDIAAVATVQFNDQSGAGFPIRRGFSISGIRFNRIYVTAAAQAGKYLTVISANRVVGQEIRAVNPDITQSEVSLLKGTDIGTSQVALANAATTAILAADTTRRSITLYNPDAANSIWIGKAAVTNLTGLEIAPKTYFTINESATIALYGYQASGAPLTISVMSEVD